MSSTIRITDLAHKRASGHGAQPGEQARPGQHVSVPGRLPAVAGWASGNAGVACGGAEGHGDSCARPPGGAAVRCALSKVLATFFNACWLF